MKGTIRVLSVIVIFLTVFFACEFIPLEEIQHSNPLDPDSENGPEVPEAVLTGLPDETSTYATIYITVGGTGITTYKYNLDGEGYSEETDVSVPINRSGLSEGSHTLSVLGKFDDGLWQWESRATSLAWTIEITSITALLSGTPSEYCRDDQLTVNVGGLDITGYKFRVDGGSWSSEVPVSTAISLSGLSETAHSLEVIGKNSLGMWQGESSASACTWISDFTPPSATPDITAFSQAYITGGSVDIGATDVDDSSTGHIVIFRYDSDLAAPSPTDGTSYTSGQVIADEVAVVYQGSTEGGFGGYTDGDVPEGRWSYIAYAHDSALNYGSSGTAGDLDSYLGILYVHYDGSDANAATVDDPVQTVQAAVDLISSLSIPTPAEIRVAGDDTETYAYGPKTSGNPVITPVSDLTFLGGYDPEDWSNRDPDTFPSVITDSNTPYYTVYINGVSGVVLDGLDIRGRDYSSSDCTTCAVEIVNSSNIRVSSCMVTGGNVFSDNCKSYAIRINASSGVEISENGCISGGYTVGAGCQAAGMYAYGESDSIVIRDNAMIRGTEESPSSGDSAAGIYLYNAGEAIIERNHIMGVPVYCSVLSYGMQIYSCDAAVIEMRNNVIHGGMTQSSTGIDLTTSSANIRNNTVVSGGEDSDNTATDIRMDGFAGCALYIENNLLGKVENTGGATFYGINEIAAAGSGATYYCRRNNFDPALSVEYHDYSSGNLTTAEAINALAECADNRVDSITINPDTGRVTDSNPGSMTFATWGYDGTKQSPAWGFSGDGDGSNRTGRTADDLGWSLGCYEYN